MASIRNVVWTFLVAGALTEAAPSVMRGPYKTELKSFSYDPMDSSNKQIDVVFPVMIENSTDL